MWLSSEIENLKLLVQSDSKLENFMTKEEIDVIKQNSTRYVNLKNQVFVPQHDRKVSYSLISLKYEFLRSKQL